MTKEEWARSWLPWLRGTAIGFPFGALPAGGTEIPTFLSYVTEKRLARNPEEFGHGAIEGVAGPEAANNAAVAGVLVPLLTLGLPTPATAAILLAAFQQYGLQPRAPAVPAGEHAHLGADRLALYRQCRCWCSICRWSGCRWLLSIPQHLLYGAILVFSTLGVYSLNGSTFDLVLLAIFGALGFIMRRSELPVAPCVIGLILGPMAEAHFRRALSISQGDLSVFVTQPISAAILALALAALVVPTVISWTRSRRAIA